ncbi:D-alanyl-D-alanine carboxypeptidase family protein [Candidatus Methylobacter favarea]|uniref:D-alanyl-D-alanine carboxypeptidase family protein n=1 Tax=Candidatus Methylobacter favarea TaxID=2707345 RepID=UPI00157BCDFE|nr:D-alanyl-D-alanine carboxypeptidase family protein [Candidatus Methylobacter favarea]
MSKAKLFLYMLMPVWLLFMSEVGYGRYSAIIIDADNGSVLHEVEATQAWYPASLTKVMTLYMTFSALKMGQVQLRDNIRTSAHAARQPNSKLGLRQGELITVEDAIIAVITRSANDAAVVLAESLEESEDYFALKMTLRAQSLGMKNTNFMNATGLPNDKQVTTSLDMAILAWRIQRDFPDYYQYFSIHSFNYKGNELRGINKFVANYPGAEGMKTGFTCGSGYNLIAAAHRNNQHLIGVVLGGMTSAERYQLMNSMMDEGFANRYSTVQPRHISNIPTVSTGVPPYQLSCGNGKASAIGDNYNEKKKAHPNKRKHSLIGKTKRLGKKTLISKKKAVNKSKAASKTKTISKSKRLGKSKNPGRIMKPASKSKRLTKSRPVASKRYRHNN